MQLSLYNRDLAHELNIPNHWQKADELMALLGRKNALGKGAVAQKYGGHQFGVWNPDLGDGRGLLLGEWQDNSGKSWDLHLKGAGQTPYSRMGDGRAVLRSTIREYLASEALDALGIPTSRALCLFSSDHPVQREQLEIGAMMIRVAPSHLRFGHFEYYYHTKQEATLNQIFEYTFKHHFPELVGVDKPHAGLLRAVVHSTAKLIAKWQAFGFCHGVMNTDNMSIHGITFDFGPYAFLDQFIPDYICNHSDHQGRYAYDQQPGAALWNLNAFAQAFMGHMDIEEIREILGEYEPALLDEYTRLMQGKFGFKVSLPNDNLIVNDFMDILVNERRDYTISFRALCEVSTSADNQAFTRHFIDQARVSKWLQRYIERINQETRTEAERMSAMQQANPSYVLRNYLAQKAIKEAQEGDFSETENLLKVLKSPFREQPGFERYAAEPPASELGIALSCSS